MNSAQVSKTEIWQQLMPSPAVWIGLAVMLGVLIWVVVKCRSIWRDDTDDDASPDQLLRHFQESQREGVLSTEEYRIIKSRIMNRRDPATETERREPAAKSTESAKGIAATNIPPREAGETDINTDASR